ncbi:hypothetical protein EHQ05_08730 [Leptospira yasudae]|uniref:Uncharacterized protein n=1 Tax=Leptospira yasudae TaxID=2202201 RepID=A0ABX9M0D5_9LEPT|nr:hypothetical protein [Leptospira yasudae]RHX78749.1 hypothetical protein DLM77_16910 [Leptospira yasudae]TGK27862.1 hypothetical protein EHQ05_08730 [Leptospira yasudae]TGM06987.1 hypothetical protein EHQ86_08785 [Leptospira yasudae]
MKLSLKDIDDIFSALAELDSDKQDYQISMKEFAVCASKERLMKTLIGKNAESWQSFKTDLVSYLSKLGFEWKPSQGQGGPMKLTKIFLPRGIGTLLAKKIFDSVQEGELGEALSFILPNMTSYLKNEPSILHLSAVRDGFKEYVFNNSTYKFKRGKGNYFYKTKNEFVYYGSENKQDEIGLGELILPKLAKCLSLEVRHSQLDRGGGKLQNYDFVGYKIESDLNFDTLSVYTFELKASNSIDSITKAISQAINYKSFSNYSYIVIPMFDYELFHDKDRFETFKQLCNTNEIGIISIEFDENNVVKEVYEVTSPPRRDLYEKTIAFEILENEQLETCPLCKRIVSRTGRSNCSWLIAIDNDNRCMKDLMDKAVSKFIIS